MRRSSPAVLPALLLLVAGLLPAHPDDALLRLSVEPGIYGREQILQLSGRDPTRQLRYAFFNPGGWGSWLPYREPLALSALPGEERGYRLKVAAQPAVASGQQPAPAAEERELAFLIDRRPPAPPEILPETGEPAGAGDPERLRLRFRSPGGERVWYAVDTADPAAGREWDGNAVELRLSDWPGEDHVLRAWCRDAAGNRSAERLYRFTLIAAPPWLEIESPAPGRFANRQLLALSTRHLRAVRYSLDGGDPLEHGRAYTGPVLLQETGTLHIRVAGVPVAGGPADARGETASAPVLRREMVIQVVPEESASLSCDAESGLFTAGLRVGATRPGGGRVLYTLSERTPTEFDDAVQGPVPLESAPLSRRGYALRLRSPDPDGRWGAEYRYFYIIDRSRPASPQVSCDRSADGAVVVTLRGAEGADLHYTLDGSLPGDASPLYMAPVRVDVTGKNGLEVRAVAVGPSRVPSEAAVRRLSFDTLPPDAPSIRLLASASPGAAPVEAVARPFVTSRPLVLSVVPPKDGQVICEVSSDGSEPRRLGSDSPILEGEQILGVPYGLRREFRLRIGSADEAGNITELPGLRTVVLDREPPSAPVLDPPPGPGSYDRPLRVLCDSPDRIFAEITRDGSTPPDPTPRSPLLDRALEVAGRAEEHVEIRLKLRLLDEAGNLSEVFGPFSYSIDLRRPVLPPLAGPENGGSTNGREANLVPGPAPFRVAFTATEDGSEPADPVPSSPLLGPDVKFTGVPGQEKTIRLKLLPISAGRSLQGDVVSWRFTIDLKAPRNPEISGCEAGARYNRPVVIVAQAGDPQDRLFVSSSDDPRSLPDPVARGVPYREPIVFDVPDGKEQPVFLRVAALDTAGNRSADDRYAAFVLDRRPPEPPEVQVAPDQPLARDRLSVLLRAAEGRIRYEMTADGGEPPVPSADSPPYQSPLLLTGRPGEEVTYRIIARVLDDLGNASSPTPVTVLRVDRRPPSAPPEPRVEALEEVVRWLVSWTLPPGHRLYYRQDAGSRAGEAFSLYAGALSLAPMETAAAAAGRSAEGPPAGLLEFYLEDEAGNRGDTRRFHLPPLRPRLAAPRVEGARDGGVYRNGVDLRAAAPQGVVHYELTSDGTLPAEVAATSPVMPSTLPLDAAGGQTLEFRLRFRAFGPEASSRPSAETRFRCTVDRTPPAPPMIEGVVPGTRYAGPQAFRLLAEEGEVFYTLAADPGPEVADGAAPPGSTAGVPAPARYGGEIRLDAPQGQVRGFRISAFSVDAAGNRSRAAPVWLVAVDRQGLHVSPSGDDRHDGSRVNPLLTLARAVSRAREDGRSVIRLAEGSYALPEGIRLGGELRIEGGFLADSWERPRFEGRSVLEPSEHFPADAPLLAVEAGRIRLAGLELRSSGRSAMTLLEVQDGAVEVEGSKLVLNDAGPPSRGSRGVMLRGGSTLLNGCELQASGAAQASLVEAVGGDSRSADCRFSGPREADEFVGLLLSGGGSHRLERVSVDAGKGRRVAAVRARGVRLEVSDSSLRSGAGSEIGVVVELEDAGLQARASVFSGDPGGAYTVGIMATRSEVSLLQVELGASARFGATGLFLRGGRTEVSRSILRGGETGEYCTLVDASGGRTVFTNSQLLGSRTGDSLGALLADEESEWLHNTVRGGTGRNLTVGLWVQEDCRLRLVNNILFREDGVKGTALRARPAGAGEERGASSAADRARPPEGMPAEWILQANCFDGWEHLLEARGPEEKVPTAAWLNGTDGDWSGGRVQGNIEEPWRRSLPQAGRGDLHLAADSRCINAGADAGVRVDMDGQTRPAPFVGASPAPDIGADEAY